MGISFEDLKKLDRGQQGDSVGSISFDALKQLDQQGAVGRSLAAAGFDPSQVDIQEGGFDSSQNASLQALRQQLQSTQLPTAQQALRQQGFNPNLAGDPLSSQQVQAGRQIIREARQVPRTDLSSSGLARSFRQAQPDIPGLRNIASGFQQSVISSGSLLERVLQNQQQADELSLAAGEVAALTPGNVVTKGIEGATRSLTDLLSVAAGGPPAIIGLFTAKATNDAVAEGREAGLDGPALASFALGKGAAEGIITGIFSKIGLGGLETPAKQIGRQTLTQVLKQFGIRSLAELPEEVLIDLTTKGIDVVSGLETAEQAFDPKRLRDEFLQTFSTVLFSVGASSGFTAPSDGITPNIQEGQQIAPEGPETAPVAGELTDIPLVPGSFETPQTEATRLLGDQATSTDLEAALNIQFVENSEGGLVIQDGETGETFILEAGQTLEDAVQEVRDTAIEEAPAGFPAAEVPTQREDITAQPNIPTQELVDVADTADIEAASREQIGAPVPEITAPRGDISINEAQKIDPFIDDQQLADINKFGLEVEKPQRDDDGSLLFQMATDPNTGSTLAFVQGENIADKVQASRRAFIEADLEQKAKERTQDEDVELIEEPPLTEQFKGIQPATQQATKLSKTALTQLKTDLNARDADMESAEQTLRQVVNSALPKDQRAVLRRALKRAKTPRALQSLRGRIENIITKAEISANRKLLNKEIKKIDFKKIGPSVRNQFGTSFEVLQGLTKENTENLTLEESRDLSTAAAQLRQADKASKALKFEGQVKAARQWASDISNAITATVKKPDKFLEKRPSFIRKFFNEGSTKPELLMQEMDGATEGPLRGLFYATPKKLRSKMFGILQEADTFVRKELDNLNLKLGSKQLGDWSRQIVGDKAKTKTVTLESGQDLNFSKAEYVSLLGLLSDPETRSLVTKSGISLKRRPTEKIVLSEADLETIESAADSKEMGVRDLMKKYMNGKLRAELNKEWVELHDFEVATKEGYWPSFRNTTLLQKVPSDFRQFIESTVEGMGLVKERSSATNAPFVIDDVFTIFDNHVRKVAGLASFGKYMRDAKMVLDDPKVISAMDNAFGNQRRKLFQKRLDVLTQDITGFNPLDTSSNLLNAFMAKRIDQATKVVLGLNPWVVMKQLPSFVVSNTEIGAANLAKATPAMNPLSKTGKAVRERMFRHSPDLWMRYRVSRLKLTSQQTVDDTGIFDKGRDLLEKSMAPISMADQMVVSTIWRAAEIQVRKETDLKGDAFFEAVNDLATTVVTRTQPATDILEQTGIGLESRQNSFAKVAAAMFSSQRIQNFNIQRRHFGNAVKLDAKALKNLTLVAVASPLMIQAINFLGRTREREERMDLSATENFMDTTIQLVEQNLGNLYGVAAAESMIRSVRRSITLGNAIRFDDPNNIIEAAVVRVGRGMVEIGQGLNNLDEQIQVGAKRGKNKGVDKLVKGTEDLLLGLPVFGGKLPVFPLRLAIGFGKEHFQSDYEVTFTERQRLNKLAQRRPLSDYEQEKLAIINKNLSFANMAHNFAEKEFISQEEANSLVDEWMDRTAFEIAELDKTGLKEGSATVEEPDPEEAAKQANLREFNTTHGIGLLNLNIRKKEIRIVKQQFEALEPKFRRAWRINNPDQAELIDEESSIKRLSRQLSTLKKNFVNPKTTATQRDRINKQLEKLLQRVKK